MDIENLSFLTEITDEDASYVNGGFWTDYDPIFYDPLYVGYVYGLSTYVDGLSIGANPPVIEPFQLLPY